MDCFGPGPDGKYPPNDRIIQCLKEHLVQRLAFLRALKADPSLLKASVTQYDTVEIWYLKMFAKEYQGKRVHVVGFIHLEGCRDESASVPHPARIEDHGDSIPIRFKSLNYTNVWYLCEKQPGGSWEGVVMRGRGGPYLYADEVLGKPIP